MKKFIFLITPFDSTVTPFQKEFEGLDFSDALFSALQFCSIHGCSTKHIE